MVRTFRPTSYLTRHAGYLAALVLPLVCATGCKLFEKETWNPNNYRDERAVDIDRRLEKPSDNIPNPF
ncbi:MAG: hypothetical protein IT425_05375 [Pirellulales bacterium]|nr:hypothetical protein [Pirellulales bacterium]